MLFAADDNDIELQNIASALTMHVFCKAPEKMVCSLVHGV
jgi:hypothetical protein